MMVHEQELVAHIETLTVRRLRAWVRQGWVRPAESEHGLRFAEPDVARVRLICELRDELGLDEATLPVVLNLIDQVHGLRAELRALAKAVEAQPEDVRRSISERLRRDGG